jgi:hypothetical protein
VTKTIISVAQYKQEETNKPGFAWGGELP